MPTALSSSSAAFAVITWTKQAKHVLKQDPPSVFRHAVHPGHDAEFNFWKNLAANLNSIYAQLQMEGVKKMLK